MGLLMTILYILLFILVLGIVVCFHEYGHYFWAKKAGILINEFAFGMGPRLVTKKKGETYWSIRALPIGGFCAMAGEDSSNQMVRPGMEVRLEVKDNIITKIVLDKRIEKYKDLPLYKVVEADIMGEGNKPLYIKAIKINKNEEMIEEKAVDVLDENNSPDKIINQALENPVAEVIEEVKEEVEYEVKRDAILVLSKKDEYNNAPYERNFSSKTAWQRFMVCLGGPLNNIILAIVVFIFMSFLVGVADTTTNKLGEVTKDSPAYNMGLRDGYTITKIGAYDIDRYDQIGDAIYNTRARALHIYYKDKNNVEHDGYAYALYGFNNLGFSSWDEDINEYNAEVLKVRVESKAALGGTNKTNAYKAGLRNEYIISQIIYKDVTYDVLSWADVYDISTTVIDGGEVQLVYQDDKGVTHTSDPYEVYSNKVLESQSYEAAIKQLGVGAKTKIKFIPCLVNGFKYFWNAATIIFSTLWLLLTSKEVGARDMGGFITILNQTATYAQSGFTNLLYFIGLLSVNLGILNLLPIPALDGGRILFIGIEAIFHKKINPKVENAIITVVFWLLMAFIIFVLFNDVFRLIFQLS